MSKKQKTKRKSPKLVLPGFEVIKKQRGFTELVLKKNGLRILHKEIKNTGVITTNITYRVGSRDEARGETGLAHMLEHMVFKPTKRDVKKKVNSGAMQFERETGCILNANTWKDRTTYFFSYPKEYVGEALRIEADRMVNVVLTDKEFLPERNNVLSEFDMNNGDPYFALSVQMVSTAFHSNTYGHETIGFREDIENYTAEKLKAFYEQYYRTDNATLMVIGDCSLEDSLGQIKKEFGSLKNPSEAIPRYNIPEPKQEGVRRSYVKRESKTNIVALGIKHNSFPTKHWYETAMLLEILAGGTDSILYTHFVDSGKAIRVETMIEPTSNENLGAIFITLAPGQSHDTIEQEALAVISKLKSKEIDSLLKKSIQKTITDELFAQGSSLKIAMELTEFVAAEKWVAYTETEKMLQSITAKDILTIRDTLFNFDSMTIGYFIGT